MSVNSKLSKTLSRLDQELFDKINLSDNEKLSFSHNTFYAGGCLNSALDRKPAKDYDLFFKNTVINNVIFLKLITKYANLAVWRAKGILPSIRYEDDPVEPGLKRGIVKCSDFDEVNSYFKKNANCPIHYISENAITLKNNQQLVLRFIGEPEVVFKTFDYDHCKLHWDRSALGPLGGRINFTPEAREAISKRELVYTSRSRFILSAFARMVKFTRRGWTAGPDTLINLAMSMKSIDLTNPVTFKEELTGLYGITPAQANWVISEAIEQDKININKAVKLLGEF